MNYSKIEKLQEIKDKITKINYDLKQLKEEKKSLEEDIINIMQSEHNFSVMWNGHIYTYVRKKWYINTFDEKRFALDNQDLYSKYIMQKEKERRYLSVKKVKRHNIDMEDEEEIYEMKFG